MTFGDNELAMMKDMAATAAEMLEAAGASGVELEYVRPNPVPGWGIHEVGHRAHGRTTRRRPS